MRRSSGARRPRAAARLLVLLYLWAFPLLGFIHLDAVHHAHQPACGGFAQEHTYPSARSGSNISNLHTRHAQSPCAVCALARSITLTQQQTAVATLPAVLFLRTSIPSTPSYRARSCVGSLGSRAPPHA